MATPTTDIVERIRVLEKRVKELEKITKDIAPVSYLLSDHRKFLLDMKLGGNDKSNAME